MAGALAKYVEGPPNFKIVGGMVHFTLGSDEHCMSVATFKAWSAYASGVVAEWQYKQLGHEPVPIGPAKKR